MALPPKITTPAGYAPAFALGFADSQGALALVNNNSPLPVALGSGTIEVQAVESATPPPPLEGTASISELAGPFAPVAGRPVVLTLAGVWEGTVTLARSTDGGVTRHQLTAAGQPWAVFSGNICEQAWFESEDGAQLYLDIALTSGTLNYRFAQ